MKALILAAGRGERMRPLTDHTPKPLLLVRGKPMIEWHLEALARGGVREVVINTAWLEERFPAALGDGARWGLKIHYSMEGRDHGGALDIGGGVAKARPLLGDAFWVVSGDIHAPDFMFDPAVAAGFERSDRLAHLWLVPNPPYHPQGDFGIDANGLAVRDTDQRLTWASFGLYRAELFDGIAAGTAAPLLPQLLKGIAQGKVSAARYLGRWDNVGTPEQLAALSTDP
ncbi:N-acetylmuramate alpha-1-phosphate uridylyltransferase MurU [Ideonella sp. BN130291]|uniref:N-acetylmuramate alpha-1-phosphate uridylyltransferase MurU n=1 Tax=Ideonella sp. BN130291 TaxID=3112940 RepID=UPI002E275505|nr:nucleotidyltransferase family protein [Ideonella sp. BN130291]